MSSRRAERNRQQQTVESNTQRPSAVSAQRLQPAPKAQPVRAQQRAARRPLAATTVQVQQPAHTRRQFSARSAPAVRQPDDMQEQHAFLDAAKNNHFGQVRSLVMAKPGLINCQPAGRWSALHQAAQFGNADDVRFLLEHGASPLVLTSDGRTPLEVAEPRVVDILMEATFSYTEACNSATDERRSASEASIQNLASFAFSSDIHDKQQEDDSKFQCHICLSDYEEGEMLRQLVCSHTFHACCVDTWLTEKSSSCPICRCDTI